MNKKRKRKKETKEINSPHIAFQLADRLDSSKSSDRSSSPSSNTTTLDPPSTNDILTIDICINNRLIIESTDSSNTRTVFH